MMSPVIYFSYKNLEIALNALRNVGYSIGIEGKSFSNANEVFINETINKILLILDRKKFFDEWGIEESKVEVTYKEIELIIECLKISKEECEEKRLKEYLNASLEEINNTLACLKYFR